jgi:flagellar motor switch protein FliN/FliY
MADTDVRECAGTAGNAHQASLGINARLVDKVSVTLEAFLGESRLTVGELAALKEGALLQLDAPLSRAVELRLNGLPVARGELVAAGDKFAVRLVEISK